MGKRYHYYACAFHARRGNRVCSNGTYPPLRAIERELLALLMDQVLAADTVGRLLAVVNARLRGQASASRPRLQELKAARRRVDRKDKQLHPVRRPRGLRLLEGALKTAGACRVTLQTELEQVERMRAPGVLQLTPSALERDLQPLVQELRSGIQGKVRDPIEWTVGKTTVDPKGSITIETKPDGLLGIEGRPALFECRGAIHGVFLRSGLNLWSPLRGSGQRKLNHQEQMASKH